MIQIDQNTLIFITMGLIFVSFWVGRFVGAWRTMSAFERHGVDIDAVIARMKK